MPTLDDIYRHIWSVYQSSSDLAPPRSWESIFSLVQSAALGPTSTLLDAGCGRGDLTFQLARRFRCHVIGMDPVDHRLQDAALHPDRPENARFLPGTLAKIPLGAASVDFLWCVDTLPHVPDLVAAFAECRRVLKSGGTMLLLAPFQTAAMHSDEADYYPHLGIVPTSVIPQNVESAFTAAGFCNHQTHHLGAELLEHDAGDAGMRELPRLAALQRNRDALITRWGPERYNTCRAFYLWIIHQLLGKLSNICYILQPR